ncbi:MAG: endolytic transglycosylase MltG [Christensenellales bacterium]
MAKKKPYRPEDDPLDSFFALSAPQRAWRILRPAAIFLISLGLALCLAVVGFHTVMNRFYRPIDEQDKTPVVVTVKKGSSSSAIANLLYDEQEDGSPGPNQLIRNKAVFKIYVDFTGVGSKLRSGTYTFNRSMTIPEIVDMLVAGDGKVQKIVKYTLIEGLTAEGMAESLVQQGVLTSAEKFLELCATMKGIATNELMITPDAAEGRTYALEGYLFPDTYEAYEGSSEETIINKMTTRFYGVISEAYILRAEELNMTMDQVVTLASLIEKEAKAADFAKVSAVFHNRLKKDMPLQSDATIQYILKSRKLIFSSEELATASPYNTYVNKGLPLGPICNPGKAAIEAALYPDEELLKGGYLYFCLKEPESGELVFSKTLDEHNKNVEKYRDLWQQADEANPG